MNDTLFQVSTAAATIEGVIRGELSFAELFNRGNFGLGTFDRIDGELIVIDGKFYQCTYDGSVKPVDPILKTPFAQLTFFVPQKTVQFSTSSLEELDQKLASQFENQNIFHAIQIEGKFDALKLRLPQPIDRGGLKELAVSQKVFTLSNVQGIAVGFWTPSYLSGMSLEGFHFHFLNDARKTGGHVLDLVFSELKIKIQPLPNYSIAMPNTPMFKKAHLDQDFRSLLHSLGKR